MKVNNIISYFTAILILFSSKVFSQQSFSCNEAANEIIIYCNNFETRLGAATESGSNNELLLDNIADAYGDTEVRNPLITVNGITSPAFIAQQRTVETVRLNNENYQTSDTSNNFSIGFVAGGVHLSNSSGPNGEGYDLLAFSFDVKNSVTGTQAPFIDIQVDVAPLFLTNTAGTDLALFFPWDEPPRFRLTLYDGQLTTSEQGVPFNQPLDDAALLGTPAPIETIELVGGMPVEPTPPYQNSVTNFARNIVRLDTSAVQDTNGTVTVMFDLLNNNLDPDERRYATFDNLKVSVLRAAAAVTKSIKTQSGINDSIGEPSETIDYEVVIHNPSVEFDAEFIDVMDNLLINHPPGATVTEPEFTSDAPTFDPDTKIIKNGDGTYTVIAIPPERNVFMNYSVILPNSGATFDALGSAIGNEVTINGMAPSDSCDPAGDSCIQIPLDETDPAIVTKTITNETGANTSIAEPGETIEYQVVITNPNPTLNIGDINVIDSLLTSLPITGVSLTGPSFTSTNPTFNEASDIIINSTGNYTITLMEPSEVITMTYSLTLPPAGADFDNLGSQLTNSVTVDGTTPPTTCNPIDNNCNVITTATPDPATIIKSITSQSGVDDTIAEPSETITYEVVITNPNTSLNIGNINVMDSLLLSIPQGVANTTPVFTSTDPGFNPNTDVITNSLGDYLILSMMPAEVITMTYSITLPPAGTDFDNLNEGVSNSVTVDGTTPPVTCNPDTDPGCVNLSSEPVDIVKSITSQSGANDTIAEPSETITYEVVITNPNTDVNIDNVPVMDSLLLNIPQGVTNTTPVFTSTDPGFNPTTDVITNSLGDYLILSMMPAEVITMTYSITLPPAGTDFDNLNEGVSNSVTVDGTTPPVTCNPDTDPGCVNLSSEPVNIVKSITSQSGANDTIAEPSETITYEVVITNPNTDVNIDNVPVMDSLLLNIPQGVTNTTPVFTSTDPGFNPTTDVITNSLGDYLILSMMPAEVITMTYSITLPPAGTDFDNLNEGVSNSVTVDGTTPPVTCNPDTDPGCVNLSSEPVDIVKSITSQSGANDTIAEPSETITYEVVITNPNTDVNIDNVPVMDSLLLNIPQGVTNTTPVFTSTDPGFNPTTDVITNSLGDYLILSMMPAEVITMTYSITLPPAGADFDNLNEGVSNSVTVDGTTPPVTCNPDTDPGCVNLSSEPVNIVKSITSQSGANDTIAEPSETITYEVVITNPNTDVNIDNVPVMDSLLLNIPQGVTNTTPVFTSTDPGFNPTTDVITNSLGDYLILSMMPAEVITMTYSITLPPAGADFDNLNEGVSNSVTVDGTTPPVTCNPDTDPGCVNLSSEPVDIVKSITSQSGANDTIAEPSETITYEVVITNPNTDVNIDNVPVMDSLLLNIPQGVTNTTPVFTSTDPGFNPTTDVITNSLGDYLILSMMPAEVITMTYSITLPPAGADFDNLNEGVSNSVTVDGTTPPVTCNPDTDPGCVNLSSEPVNIVKSITSQSGANDAIAEPSETITYEVVITNPNTDVNIDNVPVMDSLLLNIPQGVTNTTPVFTSTDPGFNPTTDVITNSLGDYLILSMMPAEVITMTYSITLPPAGTDFDNLNEGVSNSVTVDGTTPPVTCNPDTDPGCVNLSSEPVDIVKSITSQSGANDTITEPSETITYEVVITNPNTDVNIDNVPVMDSLLLNIPQGVTNTTPVFTSTDPGFNPTTDVITNSLGDYLILSMMPAEVITMTYSITLPPAGADFDNLNEGVSNSVTVDGTTPPVTCNPDTDPGCVNLSSEPVNIVKSITSQSGANDTIAEPSETITYEVVITNPNTDVNIDNVPVMDSLLLNIPQGVTNTTPVFTSTDPGFNPTTDVITNSLGDYLILSMMPAEVITMTYSITLPPAGADFDNLNEGVSNSVTVDGTTPPVTCNPDTDPGCVNLSSEPVDIVKSITSQSGANDTIAEPSETITYEVVITNPNTDVNIDNVPVMDSLLLNIPQGVTNTTPVFTSTDPGFNPTTDVITNSLGDYLILSMMPAEVITMTYSITLPPAGADFDNLNEGVSNSVTVDGTTPPVTCNPDTDPGCVNLSSEPVDIVKSITSQSGANDTIAEPSETITYEVVITNPNTDVNIDNVPVMDSLLLNIPQGVTNTTPVFTSTDPGFNPTTDVITNSLGDYLILSMMPAEVITMTYSITLPPAGADFDNLNEGVSNSVTVDGTTPPVTCNPDTDPGCVNLSSEPVNIVKSITSQSGANDTIAEPSETITYEVVITNPNTDVNIDNVPVMDSLLLNIPQGVTNTTPVFTSTDPGFNPTTDVITNSLGDYLILSMMPAEVITMTYSITLPPAGADFDNLNEGVSNSVTVDGTTPPVTCNPDTDPGCVNLGKVPPVVSISIISQTGSDNSVVEEGETVGYKIVVTNPSNQHTINDVNLKTSLLMNLPQGATFEILSFTPQSSAPKAFILSSGVTEISPGEYTIDMIMPSSSYVMTYNVTLPSKNNQFNSLGSVLSNTASVDGRTPPTPDNECIDTSISEQIDCVSLGTISTLITKDITSQSGDNDEFAEANEILSYEVVIANPSDQYEINNIVVKDSLLMELPKGVITTSPIFTPESINVTTNAPGEFLIETLLPGESLTINYGVMLPPEGNDFDALGSQIINAVTADGTTPPDNCSLSSNSCVSIAIGMLKSPAIKKVPSSYFITLLIISILIIVTSIYKRRLIRI